MTETTPATERVAVSTLELFFDLVFVFTITQLTRVLAHETTWTGLYQVILMLGIIYWMYGGYVWLTNSVSLDRFNRRLILLVGMAGFFLVALAVPSAFSGRGATFGVAYCVVVLLHLGLFVRSSKISLTRAVIGLAPFNLSTAALVLIGGLIGGTAQYVIWTIAVVGEWGSPKLFDDSGFVIEPGHFVERHGLVVLIAIGESVVAVGVGASALTVDLQLAIVAVLGLALSGCLWWTHFGQDEQGPERAMAAAPVGARPWLAIEAFGYWHMVILLGILAIATGLETATSHASHPLPRAFAVALGGGAATFLLGELLFRRTLRLGRVRYPRHRGRRGAGHDPAWHPGRGSRAARRARRRVRGHARRRGPLPRARMNEIERLAPRMWVCRRCPEAGIHVESMPVFSVSPFAEAILVGQAPGVHEPVVRRPFAASAGRTLRRWLEPAGLGDEAAFYTRLHITAVAKCFPGKARGGSDVPPSRAMLKTCRPWLDAEFAALPGLPVISVGVMALTTLAPGLKLDDAVGAELETGDGRRLFALPHPSGASPWPHLPGNRERLDRAIAQIAAALGVRSDDAER